MIAWPAALGGPLDGAGNVVAGHRHGPALAQEQLWASGGRDPVQNIALMNCFPQRNAGLAENAGEIAETGEDALAAPVLLGEQRRGFTGPGAPGRGIDLGLFPANPGFGRRAD